jgi:hypothetical protein
MMETNNKVIIGGIEYRPVASDTGTNKIVIVPNGWIFVGRVIDSTPDRIILTDAYVVRKWTNGKGIGALASTEHKSDYTLDKCYGDITVPQESINAIIDCRW